MTQEQRETIRAKAAIAILTRNCAGDPSYIEESVQTADKLVAELERTALAQTAPPYKFTPEEERHIAQSQRHQQEMNPITIHEWKCPPPEPPQQTEAELTAVLLSNAHLLLRQAQGPPSWQRQVEHWMKRLSDIKRIYGTPQSK